MGSNTPCTNEKELENKNDLIYDEKHDANKKEELITGYQAAIEQNRLYAEFRWKVFSYISTLQAGLFFIVINSNFYTQRIVCYIIGIAVSLFLWFLEKRHHQLFTQARDSGKLFEKELGIEHLGVFNNQIQQKTGLGHSKLVFLITILTTFLWGVSLICEIGVVYLRS